jgi:hypothetical protein
LLRIICRISILLLQMKARIIELLLIEDEMWMDELRQCFVTCDIKTHVCQLEPEFDDVIAQLTNQGKICMVNRLEAKGNYKRCGEVVTLRTVKN